MARAWIGCSGWSYDHWRGTVYPAGLARRAWLAHYASLFDTVELNSTFYRLPAAQTVVHWREAVPEGFRFAMKMGAFGSHRMKLSDASRWLPNHVERARLLGPTLGPTLVQLPPRWRRDVARLDEFLEAAPSDLRWAVELREPSWLHDDVFAVLRRHDAALCVHDLLDDHPFVVTAGWVYVRRHGPHGATAPYRDRYGPAALEPLAERLGSLRDDGVDAYCYFNNDEAGHAVSDARWLADRLGTGPRAVTAPPPCDR